MRFHDLGKKIQASHVGEHQFGDHDVVAEAIEQASRGGGGRGGVNLLGDTPINLELAVKFTRRRVAVYK